MLRQTLITGGLLALCGPGLTFAQPPGPPRGERGDPRGGGVEVAIAKLMAFDADKDGKLSKAEVTDARLISLWERCDADKDGVVTKDELTAQLTKEAAAFVGGRGGPGGPPPGGGPGGPPPGGPEGGPRFGGGPPALGQILPPFLQEELRLSEAQRQQLSDLQKDIDTKLAQILTREQRQQLRDMANRGPRGPGGPGGERGPGGPGGNRPPGEGRPQRPPQ